MMREYTWSGNMIRELIPIITRDSLLERVETIDRDNVGERRSAGLGLESLSSLLFSPMLTLVH